MDPKYAIPERLAMSSAVIEGGARLFDLSRLSDGFRLCSQVLGFEPPGLQLPRDAPSLVHVR